MLCRRQAAQVWLLLLAVAWLVAAVFGTEPSCPTATSNGVCTCQLGAREDLTSCSICTCKAEGETNVPYCVPAVDGHWSSWSSYSSCSVSCGIGLQTRSRTCANPLPMNNGAVCEGPLAEAVLCDTEVTCPDCVDDDADCPSRALSGECVLNSGYMLVNCRLSCGMCTANSTDMCNHPPCQVTCTNYDNLRYNCTCTGGWEGSLCDESVVLTQEDIDECVSNPCRNGGVCLDRLNGYLCRCPFGYYGLYCQSVSSVSGSSPCSTQSSGCPLLNPLTTAPLPLCNIQTGIAEGIHRLTESLTMSRMTDFVLHGKARLVSCAFMSIVGYSWAIFQPSAYPSYRNAYFAPVYGLRNPISNNKDLTLPKQTLLPGTYMVQFQVTIVDQLGISDADFVHQTWIRVVPVPLVTTLGPSLVTQHITDDVWVSAEASWDPEGLVSLSDFDFTWTCETSYGSCLAGGYVEAPGGTCLRFSTDQKPYQDARATCQAEGARLVVVKTAEMDDFLTTRYYSSIWIGLSGSLYVWSDGTTLTPSNYTNWGTSSLTYACVYFWYDGSNTRNWWTTTCTSSLYYVCEKKACLAGGYVEAPGGTCLRFSTDQKPYQDARATCQAEGARLVVVKTAEMDDFLTTPYYSSIWIGLSRSLYVWSDGTTLTPSNYTNWGTSSLTYACVYFWYDGSNTRNWWTTTCTSSLYYVCEKKGGLCGKRLHYSVNQTAGTTFNFTVQASSPDRTSIQASQLVVFQDNRACGLAIRCISNCDWSNTKSSEDLVLQAVPGSNDTPSYEWSVVEHPPDFGGLLEISSSQEEVVIAKNTFNVSGRYSLRVVNHNGVCSYDLAVSEWTFTVWGLPALRNKNLSTPCVIDRADRCVCCGEFVDGPGYFNVTYKFRPIASVEIEKGWAQFPEDEPFVQTPLPLSPYFSQVPWYCPKIFPPTGFIMELEVISIDGRVAALNITDDTGEGSLDLDALLQIQPTDIYGVLDLSTLLAMNTAELEKLSTNATLQIARGLELSAESLKILVENDTAGSISVKDINVASANIFTGSMILLEFSTTSAWDDEGRNLKDTIEVNNKSASAAFKAISNVLNMYDTLMPANGSASLEMSTLHAKVHKEPCQAARKKVFTVNDTLFVVPAFNTSGSACEGADSFGVEVINSDFNPFRYSENSHDVGSEVAGLTVWRGQDRRPVHHLPEPVDMIIPRDKQRTTSTVFKYTGWIGGSDDIIVVPFRPQRTRTALTILLDIASTNQPDLDKPLQVQLVWQRASPPTADSFEAANWTAVLPVPQDQLYTLQLQHTYNSTNLTSHPYSWLLPPEALNVTGVDKTPFYLGVKYAGEDASVTVSILESACVYFGEDSSHLWEDEGCEVGPLSNTTHLHCRCDHLTKFAGFVPPNPIYLTLSVDFIENPIGLIAVLSVFGLFVLGCLVARKADRLDLTKLGVTTPTGHTLNPDPDYCYIVTVYTGFRLDAGTTAQVSITVFGFREESEPLALQDGRRQLFQGGSVDSFLVSSENPLGPLTHIHVWHDNTGPSPGWYLSKVVIQHVSSGQLDYFICNKWLALDEDDGRIDRMVFVASPEEMAAVSNLISERAAMDFHDGHLFFSVVGRPARSTFTRAQRLACCMSTVYSTMLANIMFFGQGDAFDPPEPIRIMGVEIEPPISLPQIVIAIQSAVIIFPINSLIVLLYRNAAPKPSSTPVTKHADTKDTKAQDTQKGKGCRLPWWTATVAGLLAFAVSFVAAFFTIQYTENFGRDKAEAWFTAFITSFVTDLILIQPVKVLALAAVLGLLIRKPTTDDDPSPTEPAGDEEYLQVVAEQPAAEVTATAPPAGENLTRDRAHRIRRKRCRHILKEMMLYGLFLSVLMVMSYTERSNLAFHMNTSIRRALEGTDTFLKISDPASYWTWLEQGVLPAVHSPAWYNGRPCEENLTLSEHLTHAISPLQLRQIRTSQDQDCTVPDAMVHVADSCLDEYSASRLDTGNYSGNWEVATNYTDHDNSTDNRTIPSPWDYTYRDINNGFLYVGEHGVYPGGGYIAVLGRTLNDSLQTLAHLRSNNWLDNRTRAVFMEAVLYNPHANLFAVVTMATEFDITGRASTATELVIFRIHHRGQVLLLVLRMILMIFLLFSLVREVLRFNAYAIAYLTDPWSWLEMLIISTGMATMVLYFRAQSTTDEVSGHLKEGHVLFHLYRAAAMWYQVYTYLLGVLTCFTLVKFIRLLKFNRHVNALLYTMKRTAKPLISFFVISGIVFTAFALAANLILGVTVPGYSSLLRTYTSLFNMMLGSFPFPVLEESSPVWGPAIFFSFQCTAQFILLSMFMTIIMDVYMEVKDSDPEDVGMMAFLWEEVCAVAHKIKAAANRPITQQQQPAAREDQFTQLDQMHEKLEELDREEKCRREQHKEEREREEREREERARMVRYSQSPNLWFV